MTYEEAVAEVEVRADMLVSLPMHDTRERRAAVMRFVRDEARKIVEAAEAALVAEEAEP